MFPVVLAELEEQVQVLLARELVAVELAVAVGVEGPQRLGVAPDGVAGYAEVGQGLGHPVGLAAGRTEGRRRRRRHQGGPRRPVGGDGLAGEGDEVVRLAGVGVERVRVGAEVGGVGHTATVGFG